VGERVRARALRAAKSIAGPAGYDNNRFDRTDGEALLMLGYFLGLLRTALVLCIVMVAFPATAQSTARGGTAAAAPRDESEGAERRVDVRAAHKAACAVAYEKAQEARVDNRLREAKKHLAICAQSQCPAFIRADCAEWFEEVDQAVPSVVFSAVDATGAETGDVRVTIDGALYSERLDGAPLELDPGEHTCRFEHGDDPPIEQKTLIRAGERNRSIQISWFAGKPNDWGPQTEAAPGPLRPYAYVAGGVAAAALVSFGVFGIIGRQQEKSVKEKCEANLATCPLDEIDSAESKLLIADISLGVAAVSLLTGAVLFGLSEPKEQATAGRLSVGVGFAPNGGMARVSGSF
jgi:hypothetical protein